MLDALRGSVAECDHDDQLFPGVDLKRVRDFLIAHGDPATVEPHLLRSQHELFPVVSAFFFQIRIFLPNQRQIVCHAGELPVVHPLAAESHRLVLHQLDMQSALAVAFSDQRFKLCDRLLRQGLVSIASDSVSLLNSFLYCHIVSSL